MTTQNYIPAIKRNDPNASGWLTGGASIRTAATWTAPDGNLTGFTFQDTEGSFAASMAWGQTVPADAATYSAWIFIEKTYVPGGTKPGVGVTFGDPMAPTTYYGKLIDTYTGALSALPGWPAPVVSSVVDWSTDAWLVYVEGPNNGASTTAGIRFFGVADIAGGGTAKFWTPGLSLGSVHPLRPTVDFSLSPTIGSPPFLVDATDLSTGALTWLYAWGDGDTSATQNPSHTYSVYGRLTVSLTITTEFSGSQTETKTYYVTSQSPPATFPCIAYQNLFNDPDVTVVASSEQAGFDKENAYDYRPWTWWKPNDGDQYLELQFASAKQFNCFAVYGHDLGTNGGYVEVLFSIDSGVTWIKAFPTVMPAATECIYRRFVTTNANRIRLHVVSTPASKIACAFIGTDMELERGCKDQFGPPVLNRATMITNNQSQNGIWLGRSLIFQGSTVTINPDFLTEDFVKEQWLPFLLHAELYPWFLLWDESEHSDEASWCYSDGPIPGSVFTSFSLMNATIKAVAKQS